MLINNFNSYFELFAGLNLAYTGSEEFRQWIDGGFKELEALGNSNKDEIEQLVKSCEVAIMEDKERFPEIKAKDQQMLKDITERYKELSDGILEEAQNDSVFVKFIKPAFTIATLYSFSVVLLAAIQGGWQDNYVRFFTDICLTTIHIVIVFYLWCFDRSKNTENLGNKLPLIRSFLFLIFLSIIIAYIFTPSLCTWYSSSELSKHNTEMYEIFNIILSLFITIGAYIIHFLRVQHRDNKCKSELNVRKKELIDKLEILLKKYKINTDDIGVI